MTRIATSMISQNALFDLQRSQRTMYEASTKASSQNTASDMFGYGTKTQTLVSSQRLVARLENRITRDQELGARMTIQDTSLQQASEMMANLRATITEAVGLGSGSVVNDSMKQAFAGVRDAFNANINGRYLFAGTLNDQAPIQVGSLAELGATAAVDDAFVQGAIAQEVKIDAVQTVKLAPLATQAAESSLDALRSMQVFADSIGGFGDPMTDAQKDFLKSMLTQLDTANADLIAAQGANGQAQGQIDSAIERQTNQLNSLNNSIGETVNVDLAEVALQLNQAQLSYEASASIFNTLRGLTLLNVL